MAISEMLVPEFDQEMAMTRRALERVEDEAMHWKPQERSMSLAELTGHLAEVPSWVPKIMESPEIDLMPKDGPQYEPFVPKTYLDVLKQFDKNVEAARAALLAASDEAYLAQWTLKAAGKEVFSLPRVAVLRTMVLNHQIHHRGQLTVYYRLLGIPVPALYGPSADEGGLE
ncbi:MAG TPA: DinB family protein [Bryobacteraceae bacterium]|nr:DinB family protein [Bryobacteraceae bacterium]